MRLGAIFAGSALVAAAFASPSMAQTTSAASAANPAKPERMICRRGQDTGRLVGTRICKKESEWARQAGKSSDAAQRLIDMGTVNSCGASTPGACSGKIGD